MKYVLTLLVVLALIGCGKKDDQTKKTDDKAGAANASMMEVIGKDGGFIIENAKLVSGGEKAEFKLSDEVPLTKGTSSVLVIRGNGQGDNTTTILALQFPSFAEGTTQEYNGDTTMARFCAMGEPNGARVAYLTGVVSGSIRFTKKSNSTIDMGLNRPIMEGVGEIEVVVANISATGLPIPKEKKYVARFQLPIVTLEEMRKLNTAS